MADPFEVRMRFTSQLQHLNASTTSATRAAHYALKYRDMDEDLHSCILEQLERVSAVLYNPHLPQDLLSLTDPQQNNLNSRANIMYFMEHLCDLSAREEHPEFIRMMERDILKIIDLVAPDDGSGAANVKVVRKVLAGMQAKQYLQPQTVAELEECIKDRDQLGGGGMDGGMSPMDVDAKTMTTGKEQNGARTSHSKHGTPLAKGVNGNVRLDKKQIEQRIEEDRERHKRLRENIWAVGPTDDEEFDRLWEETSEMGEDDYIIAAEEAEERAAFAGFHEAEELGR